MVIKMERENEKNVLDELSKGCCMGVDAINIIFDKVEDDNLKDILQKQRDEYENVKSKIDNIYPEYSDKDPHETSAMNKAMTWYGIEMKTFMDNSTSKIAEILLQGTNMGIIEGRRLLNKNDVDEKINSLLTEYVNMQEELVENLKKFL